MLFSVLQSVLTWRSMTFQPEHRQSCRHLQPPCMQLAGTVSASRTANSTMSKCTLCMRQAHVPACESGTSSYDSAAGPGSSKSKNGNFPGI